MKRVVFIVILLLLGLTACGKTENTTITDEKNINTPETIKSIETVEESTDINSNTSAEINNEIREYKIDCSSYFNDINGCAVIFDYANNIYYIHNEELANKQVSPFSTFKIISTLIGLNNNVLVNKDTTMGYEGKVYPRDQWNYDVTLQEAFQESCLWYFRKIINQVGEETVQSELSELKYGNCDVSVWNGSGINPIEDLNGFWIGSSLKISPFEQTRVLADIFEGNTSYTIEDVILLKDIMLVKEAENPKKDLYGKTGTGFNGNGWFVGFGEENGQRYYFAIYMEDEEMNAKGSMAKEVGIEIMENLQDVIMVKN